MDITFCEGVGNENEVVEGGRDFRSNFETLKKVMVNFLFAK